MIPSLTVVSLYGPALSFCRSGKIFLARLKETTFWGISHHTKLNTIPLWLISDHKDDEEDDTEPFILILKKKVKKYTKWSVVLNFSMDNVKGHKNSEEPFFMKKLVQRRWGRWQKSRWRTWNIIKMARRTTMKPRRLVHSLGDARPLPRPGFKVVLCTFFFSAEQKRKICFLYFLT